MSNTNERTKVKQAWVNFGAVAGDEVIKDLMYMATDHLVVPGDSIATGQKIGRRDLALEILNKMGVV